MINNLKDAVKWSNQLSQAGCSSISWETINHQPLWGRNFDFHEWIDGTTGIFIPRNYKYYLSGNNLEKNVNYKTETYSNYAVSGVGTNISKTTPVLFDGINEQGLMGGLLYFVNCAKYSQDIKSNTLPIQPAFLVTHILSQCKNIDDVENIVMNKVSIMNETIFNNLLQLHYIFCDKYGETAIIECDTSGVHIYRNTMGILTNSPNYKWQKSNL